MDPSEDPTVQTTIYLPASLRAWLEVERRERGLSLTVYIRQMIERQRDRAALAREVRDQGAGDTSGEPRYPLLDRASHTAFGRVAWGEDGE